MLYVTPNPDRKHLIALTQVCLCHAKERREELSYSVKEANVQLGQAKSRKYCRVSEVYLGRLKAMRKGRNIISLTNSFCGQHRKSWSSCCRVMYFWCRRRRSRQRKRKHLTKFSRENVVSLERLATGLVLIIKMINPLFAPAQPTYKCKIHKF